MSRTLIQSTNSRHWIDLSIFRLNENHCNAFIYVSNLTQALRIRIQHSFRNLTKIVCKKKKNKIRNCV